MVSLGPDTVSSESPRGMACGTVAIVTRCAPVLGDGNRRSGVSKGGQHSELTDQGVRHVAHSPSPWPFRVQSILAREHPTSGISTSGDAPAQRDALRTPREPPPATATQPIGLVERLPAPSTWNAPESHCPRAPRRRPSRPVFAVHARFVRPPRVGQAPITGPRQRFPARGRSRPPRCAKAPRRRPSAASPTATGRAADAS